MSNNHHFRSLSAQPQPHQHQQQQQQPNQQSPIRLQPNGQATTVQPQLGQSIIKVYSDHRQSLDKLFNPQEIATSVPLRNRNLPQSFFKPNSQSTASSNAYPKASLHSRSISSIDNGYSSVSQVGLAGNKTTHVRTHSNITPMMDLLEIASNSSSTNNLNEISNAASRPALHGQNYQNNNHQQQHINYDNTTSMSTSTEQLMSTDQGPLVQTPPVPYPRTGYSSVATNQVATGSTQNVCRSNINGNHQIVGAQTTSHHGRSFSLDQRNVNVNSMRSIGPQYGLGNPIMNSGTNITHSRTHSTLEPMLEVATNDNPMSVNSYHNATNTHYTPITTNQTIFGDRNTGPTGAIANNTNQPPIINGPLANGSTNSSNSNVSYCYSGYSSGFGSDEIPLMPQEQLYNSEINGITMESKPPQQQPMQPQGNLNYFANSSHMPPHNGNYIQQTTQSTTGADATGYMVDYNEF